MVCNGCLLAARYDTCPFCKTPVPNNNAKVLSLIQTHVDKKNPKAIKFLGDQYLHGDLGLKKDTSRAVELWTKAAELGSVDAIKFLGDLYSQGRLGLKKDMSQAVELWTKAAELGSVDACYDLGRIYDDGLVVEMDVSKSIRFYEQAAVLGHPLARLLLGELECENGNYDRAVRLFLVSAKMGVEKSVTAMKILFDRGVATKSQYVEALKGCQEPRKG